MLVSRAPPEQQWLRVNALRPPGPQLGVGRGGGGPSPEQEPALSCWSYLVRLQLFPNGLDGVPALAEHGLKQALLGLLTLGLKRGREQCSDGASAL